MTQRLFATLFLSLIALPVLASDQARQLLQLVDYVGVDYAVAVRDGEIISAPEYAEMQNFAGLIERGLAALPQTGGSAALAAASRRLSAQIEAKAPPAEVAATARRIRELLMQHYDVVSLPRRAPDLQQAARLYQQQCAACHGAEGRGDGPAAAGLEPPPTDFHDTERAAQRSLFGLYNTITLGVDGTAMTSFAHLTDAERWALAFYVGGKYADEELLAAGAGALEGGKPDLHAAVTTPPAEMPGRGLARAAWLRQHPEVLFTGQPGPLDIAAQRLEDSVAQYRAGKPQAANQAAVSAYLDGFELSEAALRNVAPELVLKVEEAMLRMRTLIQEGAPQAAVAEHAAATQALLDQARQALEGESLSSGVAFTSSLVILLREGLEAILILGAIAAFLIKTNRRDALLYMHYGWLGALAAGIATWMISTYVINISGAARELTEGFTALIAAVVLFYVGFWMHNKLSAARWNRFIREKVESALNRRTLWGIALIAFVAVYREVFETVLFYQALWAQVTVEAHDAVFGGAGLAAVILVVLSWGIFRFGLRLPLKQFFAISSAIMFILAVIFAGKGVVALQEAGHLPIDPVSFPRVELLGIYPNIQSLGLQAALALIAIGLVLWNRRDSGMRA